MQTLKTEINGRKYEVDIHPEKIDDHLSGYAQVYRIRKNGTRGRKLLGCDIVFHILKQAEKESANV